MLRAKLSSNSLLKKIVDAVKDLISDANIEFTNSGLSLQAMDSSHVSLVSLIIPPEEFEVYKCEKILSLGINLNWFYKILKCATNEDSVEIIYKNNENFITFLFKNEVNERSSEFQLRLLEINNETLGIPETIYSAVVTLTAVEYKRVCSEMLTIGDTVYLSISENTIKFEIEGEVGKGSISLKSHILEENSVEDNTKISDKEIIKMGFALRYLNTFARAVPLSDKVTLKMSKDVPLQLEFSFGIKSLLRYYLAPKVDN